MNTSIADHGELDFLTPSAPTDVDRAIADNINLALAERRLYLNTQERLREKAKARALKEQADRDFLTHNKDEANHAD